MVVVQNSDYFMVLILFKLGMADADVRPYLTLSLNRYRFPGVDGTPKLKFVDDDINYNSINKKNRGIDGTKFQGPNYPWESVSSHTQF